MKQKIPKNAKIPFMKVIKKKWRLLVMLFPAMLFVFIFSYYESNKEKMAFACNAFSSNAVCFYFFLYSYGRNYIGI